MLLATYACQTSQPIELMLFGAPSATHLPARFSSGSQLPGLSVQA